MVLDDRGKVCMFFLMDKWAYEAQQLKKVIAVVKHHYVLKTPLKNPKDNQQETIKKKMGSSETTRDASIF